MKITTGIHRIGSGLVNAYLVEENGEVTIIDAGLPGYWRDLPGELAAMGRSLADVRAVVLIALQPRIVRAMGHRRAEGREHTVPLVIAIYLNGIYGGYFGAGQGVIMMAVLGVFLPDALQRLNGLKNALTVLVNGVAGILFILVAPVAWPPAILIAIGAIIGGQVGASVGRRLPAPVLRAAIIVIGTFVGIRLLIG